MMTIYDLLAIAIALTLIASWGFKALDPEQMPKSTALNLLGLIVIAVMLIISSGALFS